MHLSEMLHDSAALLYGRLLRYRGKLKNKGIIKLPHSREYHFPGNLTSQSELHYGATAQQLHNLMPYVLMQACRCGVMHHR